MSIISRRKFIGLTALAIPAVIGADARWIEPTSLRVTNLKLSDNAKHRFVHFTDFHHKGDTDYAAKVIRTINELNPEFVCFTGDLVEDRHYLEEALGFIREIKAPVYGNPGNHDYWSKASFDRIAQCRNTISSLSAWACADLPLTSRHPRKNAFC